MTQSGATVTAVFALSCRLLFVRSQLYEGFIREYQTQTLAEHSKNARLITLVVIGKADGKQARSRLRFLLRKTLNALERKVTQPQCRSTARQP